MAMVRVEVNRQELHGGGYLSGIVLREGPAIAIPILGDPARGAQWEVRAEVQHLILRRSL